MLMQLHPSRPSASLWPEGIGRRWGSLEAERTALEMAGSENAVQVKAMTVVESPVKQWVEDWTIAAACRGMDPDELFVQGAAQNRAKTVCAACPVRTECLADALDNRVEFGVWGGMTERERRALLRRRPDVRSWRKVLEGAREAYQRQRTVIAAGS
jgi:WhiB family redox-sensing transcriptional regulator